MASLTGFATAITITIFLLLTGDSTGRELRPSSHGLSFQASPPANYSLEMRSFFNTNKGSSSSSSYSSSSSSSDASPRNITESLPPAWWRVTHGGGGGGRRLERALVMASLVCGITGGTLLLASGLLYLFKKRIELSIC